MPMCWARGCSNSSGRRGNCKSPWGLPLPESAKISFHLFPVAKPGLLRTWLHNIGKKESFPTERAVLCSVHFLEECFVPDVYSQLMLTPTQRLRRKRLLKKDAVPTEFAHRKTAGLKESSAIRKRDRAQLLNGLLSNSRPTESTPVKVNKHLPIPDVHDPTQSTASPRPGEKPGLAIVKTEVVDDSPEPAVAFPESADVDLQHEARTQPSPDTQTEPGTWHIRVEGDDTTGEPQVWQVIKQENADADLDEYCHVEEKERAPINHDSAQSNDRVIHVTGEQPGLAIVKTEVDDDSAEPAVAFPETADVDLQHEARTQPSPDTQTEPGTWHIRVEGDDTTGEPQVWQVIKQENADADLDEYGHVEEKERATINSVSAQSNDRVIHVTGFHLNQMGQATVEGNSTVLLNQGSQMKRKVAEDFDIVSSKQKVLTIHVPNKPGKIIKLTKVNRISPGSNSCSPPAHSCNAYPQSTSVSAPCSSAPAHPSSFPAQLASAPAHPSSFPAQLASAPAHPSSSAAQLNSASAQPCSLPAHSLKDSAHSCSAPKSSWSACTTSHSWPSSPSSPSHSDLTSEHPCTAQSCPSPARHCSSSSHLCLDSCSAPVVPDQKPATSTTPASDQPLTADRCLQPAYLSPFNLINPNTEKAVPQTSTYSCPQPDQSVYPQGHPSGNPQPFSEVFARLDQMMRYMKRLEEKVDSIKSYVSTAHYSPGGRNSVPAATQTDCSAVLPIGLNHTDTTAGTFSQTDT